MDIPATPQFCTLGTGNTVISRNFSSIDQGLVDELLQFSPNRIGAARKQLRIETNAQILGRIDQKTVDAAPPHEKVPPT